MSRRRQESALDAFFEVLKIAPFWLGPVVALVVFLLCCFVFPAFLPNNVEGAINSASLFRPLFLMLSWLAPCVILFIWLMAEIWKLWNRRSFDRQSSLASIHSLSWQEFELFVCDMYRQMGYVAEHIGSAGGDGGVDIRMSKGGETVLVQCKQLRRTWKVKVNVVRELLGVMVSQRADRCIIVTSGRFMPSAIAFARQNPRIELVDGQKLTEIAHRIQSGTK